jgi:hypothetical protein
VTFTLLNGSNQTVGTPVNGSVSNGSASANYTLPAGTPVGSYTIQAFFGGNSNFNPSGDSSHTLTVSGVATTTTAATVTTSYSPSNQALTLTASVTSGAGTVNAGSVIFAVYNGGTQIGFSTSAANVSNGGASASYMLPGATAPGTYSIVASYTGAGGFLSSIDSSHSVVVNKASAVITWPTPAPIVFGGALSSSQLNATVNIPGSLVYTPPAGTVLSVGNQTLSVQFTPNDLVDYVVTTQTVQITVNMAPVPATLIMTQTLTRDGTGNVIMTLTLANTGGVAATNVQITTASLASTGTITALPLSVADVAPGGTSTVTLTFPSTVGNPGDSDLIVINGTYNAGSFGANARVTLP